MTWRKKESNKPVLVYTSCLREKEMTYDMEQSMQHNRRGVNVNRLFGGLNWVIKGYLEVLIRCLSVPIVQHSFPVIGCATCNVLILSSTPRYVPSASAV